MVIMNMLEEITKIVVRIREIKSRIHGNEDDSNTWLDQIELEELKSRLEKMRHELIKTKEA